MSSSRNNTAKKIKKKLQKNNPPDTNNQSIGANKVKELPNRKINSYFTGEEIAEIRNALKTKDLSATPLLIAATICRKFDLVKKLVKDGHNINQTGLNNMTALTWGVKHKSTEIVNYLLSNGADPTIKTDSGDNVLVMALEHKLWDEDSFADLWRLVKKVSFVDVNFTNKNGHNMIHMCVRRDWGRLLKLLLAEKPNVDAPNANGVTPLMLACFRNNLDVVDALIEAGGDVTTEDNHGRTTLCYAISTALKTLKPPFPVAERIIRELDKQKSSFGAYLKRRLDLIIASGRKSEISTSTCEMLIRIIRFSVDFTENGLKILLEAKILPRIRDALEHSSNNADVVKFFLNVIKETVFCDCRNYHEESITEEIFASGLVEIFFDLLARDSKNREITKITTNLLILSFKNEDKYRYLYRIKNELLLISLLTHIKENHGDLLAQIEDKDKADIFKKKYEELLKFLEILEKAANECQNSSEDNRRKFDSSTSNNGSKRSRRRSKAIKAKLTKMKTADFTRRLNLNNGKRGNNHQSKIVKIPSKSESLTIETNKSEDNIVDNEIVSSFSYLLRTNTQQESNFHEDENNENAPKWKKDVLKLKFSDFSRDGRSFPMDTEKLVIAWKNLKKSVEIKKSLSAIVDYLKILVDIIVEKYREKWEEEKISGTCSCGEIQEHSPWRLMGHLQTISAQEQNSVTNLKCNFDGFTRNLKENCTNKNLDQIVSSLERTEKKLLNYEIRGIKLMSHVTNLERVAFKYPKKFTSKDEFLKHVEATLNSNAENNEIDSKIEVIDKDEDPNFLEVYKNETPFELYCSEVSKLPKIAKNRSGDWKRREIEAKLNTIANGFHLINSTMSLCNDEDAEITNQRCYSVSDLNPKLKATNNTQKDNNKRSREIERIPNRLKSQIAGLRSLDGVQTLLLGGAVRICAREQRINYVISAGINFNAVELGLDIDDRPLAIKRIRKESWIGRMVKTLVEPLLGFAHSNILPYVACEHDGEELILATPLCKWNLSQYLQIARNNNNTNNGGNLLLQVFKNSLAGLAALHKCEGVQIVHGNLKPSNIFVDFDGVVKVGEFGMHKALYKVIEAPKSSLIWFAKETLEVYMSSSMVECSPISDIQVAGMLGGFILSWGKHPFGEDPDIIIENIRGGVVPQIPIGDVDVRDLLLWMMADDPENRPQIEQVLAHTAFWNLSKKWTFILSCSGVTQNNFPLPINVDKLHRSIDTFSGGFPQIEWRDIARCRYPEARLNENDSSTGLLKFIKTLCDLRPDLASNDSDLSRLILTSFPNLPVTLFRILQNTNWLKHGVFTPFSVLF